VQRGTGRLVAYSGPALRAGGGVGNRRAANPRQSGHEPEGADGAGAPVRFVVLAAPRTGSNMLCSMLNGHPRVLCHHEMFNPEGIHYALDCRAGEIDLGPVSDRDIDPMGFLGRIWRHDRGASALGFKLNRGQNDAVFRAVLADRAIRKIILVRRNRIQTFISERIALRTGEWESYEFSDHRPFRCRLHVEAAELRAHVAANDRYYGAMRDLLGTTGQVWLEIAYEDLAGRTSQRRLLHYLGVRSGMAALRPATRKVSADDLRDVVTNHAELAAELAGSGLEADLKAGSPWPRSQNPQATLGDF
jgi:LPS sulfotransferase NodH